MLNIDEVTERIRGMISSYLEHFGQAYTGLYCLSSVTDMPGWTTFLTILKITLNRDGLRPGHVWIRHGKDALLLLCVNGYFRTNMDDVTETMKRLWILRATYDTMPRLVKEWKTDSSNAEDVICAIYQTLGDFSFPRCHGYRKHGFGGSMF